MVRLHFELQVNPGRSRFGHSITYNRCLHETGTYEVNLGVGRSSFGRSIIYNRFLYMRLGWKMFRPV